MFDEEAGTYKVRPEDPVVVYKNGGFGFNFKNKEAVKKLVKNFKEVAEFEQKRSKAGLRLKDLLPILGSDIDLYAKGTDKSEHIMHVENESFECIRTFLKNFLDCPVISILSDEFVLHVIIKI